MKRIAKFLLLTFLLAGLGIFFSPANVCAAGEPYFRDCNVMARNTPGGVQTTPNARVFDSNGTVPDTISSLTVSGPGGFAYSFTQADYGAYYNQYWHAIPGQPADGEYTFTVTDNEGKTAPSHYYLEVGTIIPLPDPASLQASGDPLAPTLRWGAVSGYEGNLFYRARIFDTQDNNIVWTSRFTTETSINVPEEMLEQGVSYEWHVEAFDNYCWDASDNRAVSERVPLAIDNSPPYFVWACVYSGRGEPGFYTAFLASVIDPNGTLPESIDSFTVTGPGVNFAFQPSELTQYGDEYIYEHHIDGKPQDGIYTFTLTDNEQKTSVTHDYVKVHDVPLIDSVTLQASGDPLTPTVSWGAPANMDQSLYYQVMISDKQGDWGWRSWMTAETFLAVPNGTLQDGVEYRWHVRAVDAKYWVHFSNRSNSNQADLVIGNARPYFQYATVYKRHDPDGIFTALDISVIDPNGAMPDSITLLTVEDQDGNPIYTFQPEDYSSYWKSYFHRIQGAPDEGVYTITATDTENNTSVTHAHVKAVDDIPSFDEESFLVSGNLLAPSISWGAVSGYQRHLYYRFWVMDSQGNFVYMSRRQPYTAQTVPEGVIQEGKSYLFRVEAYDHQDWIIYNSRYNSRWFLLFECEEDNSGALDIVGKAGAPGGTVTIPVRIQNAPNEIDSLGFEVTFIPTLLSYTGFTRGPLVENFVFFDVANPEPGLIRIGGFEVGEDTIAAGASGDVVYLNFEVIQCTASASYPLDLQELKDDLAGWPTSGGCFQCGCNGDVNGDGEITPMDALCAFETYLGICPTSCDIPCEEVCCDVTLDDDCTPADALCIFQKYLGLPSCLD